MVDWRNLLERKVASTAHMAISPKSWVTSMGCFASGSMNSALCKKPLIPQNYTIIINMSLALLIWLYLEQQYKAFLIILSLLIMLLTLSILTLPWTTVQGIGDLAEDLQAGALLHRVVLHATVIHGTLHLLCPRVEGGLEASIQYHVSINWISG